MSVLRERHERLQIGPRIARGEHADDQMQRQRTLAIAATQRLGDGDGRRAIMTAVDPEFATLG